MTATAGGSPSGIDGLECSIDGEPAQWYSGATAQVAVNGIGDHTLRCAAANNAVDEAGNHGWSNWATWGLNIRQQTIDEISFSKLVDALQCRRVRQRIEIPAHRVTVRRRHKLVGVTVPAHSKTVSQIRCRARVVRRRIAVWKTVNRNGRKVRTKRYKTVKVVELPHVVSRNSKRVQNGQGTSVSGWLGMPDGTALAGQPVRVLTAPDNGLGQFSQAAIVITAADGSWTAKLPPGPSRLVEAVFDGAPVLEPSSSGQVDVLVPAKVKLISIRPSRIPWGGTSSYRWRTCRWLLAPRWCARPAAHRLRQLVHDVWSARARHGQRQVLDYLHLRHWGSERGSFLLVPDRVASHGQLPVGTIGERARHSYRRRLPGLGASAPRPPS